MVLLSGWKKNLIVNIVNVESSCVDGLLLGKNVMVRQGVKKLQID